MPTQSLTPIHIFALLVATSPNIQHLCTGGNRSTWQAWEGNPSRQAWEEHAISTQTILLLIYNRNITDASDNILAYWRLNVGSHDMTVTDWLNESTVTPIQHSIFTLLFCILAP